MPFGSTTKVEDLRARKNKNKRASIDGSSSSDVGNDVEKKEKSKRRKSEPRESVSEAITETPSSKSKKSKKSKKD